MFGGDSNFGLKHILDKHGGEFKDIAKELDAIVENGAVVKTHNGYNITLGDYKVGLNIGWNENGVKIGENKWVVTAFDNSKLQSEKQGSNSASFTKGETLPLNSKDIIPQTQSKATTQETTNTQGLQTFNPTKFVLGFADELAGFGILTRTRALSKIDDYVQRQLSKNQDLANNPAELERTLRNDMNSKINQAKQRLKAEENKGIHNANEVDFKNPPKERTLFDFLDEDTQKEVTQPKEYNIYNLPPKAPQPKDESSIKLVDKDTIQTISIDKDTQEAITKTEIRDLQLPSAKLEGENFHFEPYDEVINPKQRIQNNIKAIEILQDLQKNPRELSNEQKSILNSYSGFGGLSSAFREGSESLAKLESLLDTTTLRNLKGTILDAYYTPTHIIKGIYQALEDFLPKVLVPF